MRIIKQKEKYFVYIPKKILEELGLKEDDELVPVSVGKKFLALLPKKFLEEIIKSMLLKPEEMKRASQLKEAEKKGYWVELLESKGYLIVESEKVGDVWPEIEPLLESGEYVGTKGFDGKLYIAKAKLLQRLGYRFKRLLKRPMTLGEIAQITKLSEKLCRVVLEIMMDQGEVIEERPGVYRVLSSTTTR